MGNMEREVNALKDRCVNALRAALRRPEDERAPILREAADALVSLRALHTTKDGLTDWRGQSWDYRSLVTEIYAEAGLDAAGEGGVKVALRYHVGNALRDSLSDDELEEAGLTLKAPRSRMAWRYKEGANRAEFARALVYRIVRTPAMEPDAQTLEHAIRLHAELGEWIKRHS